MKLHLPPVREVFRFRPSCPLSALLPVPGGSERFENGLDEREIAAQGTRVEERAIRWWWGERCGEGFCEDAAGGPDVEGGAVGAVAEEEFGGAVGGCADVGDFVGRCFFGGGGGGGGGGKGRGGGFVG